jgi:signal transduction histidine kinase/ActR/RegA family two-component response regulator
VPNALETTVLSHIKTKAAIVSFFLIAIVGVTAYYMAMEIHNHQSETRLRDAMLEVRAFHLYIQKDMHPNYYRLMDEGRLPKGFYAPEMLSSSYMARNFQKYYNDERVAIGLPEVHYKMAVEDPRNPVNKATESEAELLKWFNEDPHRSHRRLVREENGQKYLVVAVPFLRNEEKCLVCHGTPFKAPGQLQELYEWSGGYNRIVGKISAIEIMKTPIQSQFGVPFYVSISALILSSGLAVIVIGGYLCRVQVKSATGKLQKQQELLIMEKERAESANHAKSAFLANMSHEIRTPLNGVLGMLQLLQYTGASDEQRDYILNAVKSTNRLNRVLSDILDISRIEAGRMQLVESEVDIRQLKDSIEDLFSISARDKGLELIVSHDHNVPGAIVGDETRLLQVLFNLVGNAIKFTEKGAVTVNVSALPLSAGADIRLLVTVSDTGIGISDENLQKIFDPFVQVEGSYTRRFQGAGLGLSIVRSLVKLLGGEIAIESAPGEGTTVYLSLPFKLPKGGVGESGQGADVKPLSGEAPLRILFAEDDTVSSLSGKRMLEKAGHSVATATDGRQAFELLTKQDFDLILMDIQMPAMDGVETTKAIRGASRLGAKSRIPIVAMTAYAMTGDKEKFLAAGMDDYVAKPVDQGALLEAIARVQARRAPGA